MKPELKLFFLLTTSLLMIANVYVAQADVIKEYNVTEAYSDSTTFTGSFAYESITRTISEVMTGPPQTLASLTYQVAMASVTIGDEIATIFAVNSTSVFSQGGYGYNQGQTIYGNYNAYAIEFTAGGLMGGSTYMTGHGTQGNGGTMGGYPISETSSPAVPEPEEYGMMLLGFGLVGISLNANRGRVRN